MHKSFLHIILCIFPIFLFGQEFNYVHYDTKDGLAGSTVYSATQDKDGFMWFATEFGVSKFDGKTFKNFTTDNGLTDNEVLKVSADKKGRVWIMPYNKSLVCYSQGKFINAGNLYGINLQTRIVNYCVLENGNFLIVCNSKIYELKDRGEKRIIVNLDTLLKINSSNYNEIRILNMYYKLVEGVNRLFIIINENKFEVDGSVLRFVEKVDTSYYSLQSKNQLAVTSGGTFPFFKINGIDKGVSSICEISAGKNYLISTMNNGCYFMDSLGNINFSNGLLKGKKVSQIYVDTEGNIWFSTLGEGVYKLNSTDINSFNNYGEVFTVCPYGNSVYAGTSSGTLFLVNNHNVIKEYSFHKFDYQGQDKRLYCFKKSEDNSLFLGFDCFLLKMRNNTTTYSPIRPIKSIDVFDDNSIIVATNIAVLKINKSNLAITDTLLRERGTKVICDKGRVYVGTLKGVKMIESNKKVTDLTIQIPILSRRITDMAKADDGSLWIATNDTGIIHYSNGKVLSHITTANKLSSNLCRALFLDNKFLWAGTNKGLNKIDISTTNYTTTKYSESDGLPSNVINAIYAKDSIVYVGSPAGLTYFNVNSISHTSICNIVLENISVSDKHLDSLNNIHLKYYDNNISFNYNAISFKSGGDITYYYRLCPLDKKWKETRLTTLSYPSLPSGKYTLQLYAVNKFGKKSEVIVVDFEIDTAFWKTIWFLFLVFIVCIAVVGLLVRRRYIKAQEINNEKARVKQQLAILEQSALQAQMNPHFIFNCLNSIQQFIMLNNKELANKYLTEFAGLVRNTFDNSGKKYITVAEEAEYLDKYLDLEQLRYGDDFKYEINIDNSVEKNFTEIPAMLLQPYVENCLRHGIRNKTNGGGIVSINFKQEDNILECTIADNGVGRAAAKLLKSKEHIEYQSKGMNLTARRIELLNTALENKISVVVKDLIDEAGNSLGTEVIVKIPLI